MVRCQRHDLVIRITYRFATAFDCSPTIHVWYIHLHLVDFYGKCRYIYHTWIQWGWTVKHMLVISMRHHPIIERIFHKRCNSTIRRFFGNPIGQRKKGGRWEKQWFSWLPHHQNTKTNIRNDSQHRCSLDASTSCDIFLHMSQNTTPLDPKNHEQCRF